MWITNIPYIFLPTEGARILAPRFHKNQHVLISMKKKKFIREKEKRKPLRFMKSYLMILRNIRRKFCFQSQNRGGGREEKTRQKVETWEHAAPFQNPALAVFKRF